MPNLRVPEIPQMEVKFMKLKHLLTVIIMAAAFTVSSALTVFAAPAKGRFEEVTSQTISGWAYDSDEPDQALNVHIVIKKETTGEEVLNERLSAGEFRKNLLDDRKGNGNHGFTLNVDWASFGDGVYVIEGSVDGRAFSNTRTYTNGTPEAVMEPDAASSTVPQLQSLGIFKTTGYCPCKSCSGSWGRHTSTGAVATARHTIAVDPSVVPYGSKIMINGTVYTAEDKGGGVRGRHIDIFYDTHAESKHHGVQNTEVFLVRA